MVFDDKWFKQKQGLLLWIANSPFRSMFLKILGVKDNGLPIVNIVPNGIVYVKEDKYVAVLYSGDIISKILYKKLKPFWEMLHTIDIELINKIFPKYNLGFDSVPFFPSAGTGGSSCDGYIQTVDAYTYTWTDLRNSSFYTANAVTTNLNIGYDKYFGFLSRGVFVFDTSILPDLGEINLATLSLSSGNYSYDGQYCGTKCKESCSYPCLCNCYETLGTVYLTVREFTKTGSTVPNIQSADWFSFGDTDLSNSISGANTSLQFPLNTTGLTQINKTGVTKLGVMVREDKNGSPDPSTTYWSYWTNVYTADLNIASLAPTLTVVYSSGKNIVQKYLRREAMNNYMRHSRVKLLQKKK